MDRNDIKKLKNQENQKKYYDKNREKVKKHNLDYYYKVKYNSNKYNDEQYVKERINKLENELIILKDKLNIILNKNE